MTQNKNSFDDREENLWEDEGRNGDEADDGGNEKGKDDNVIMPKSKMLLIKRLLSNIKENSDNLNNLLAPFLEAGDEQRISIGQMADEEFKGESEDHDGRIIEGVFDGESMVGPDGKIYSVPANYASKSKLVEGDIMKLTITPTGTFIYKQIGPIERSRIVGKLERAADGNYTVTVDGKRWRILTASVTYFKGQPGDEAIILVPKAGESKWAAVENIIRNKE